MDCSPSILSFKHILLSVRRFRVALYRNKLSVIIFLLLWPSLAYSQIIVNYITPVDITCPNNGIISIGATTSNPPLLYSIISGPVTQPVQTNPLFTSLPPGNYVIKMADGAGNETTANVTIAGTYNNPTFTIAPTTPYCIGNSDGQLEGNINPGTGAPPFYWELLAPSPVTAPQQLSNTFSGLPAGNYAMRVTDACGSISSNAISLQNPVTGFGWLGQSIGQQGNLIFNKIGCDSMLVTYWLSIPNPRMPLTFKYNTSNGVYIPTSGTIVDTTFMSSTTNSQVMVSQIIPGLDYGQSVQATIYNACGDSAMSMDIITHPFIFYPKYTFNECGNTANVTFTNTPYYEYHTSINTQATYIFTDASNNVLESGTITAQQNNGIFSMSDTLTTGETYHFSITDGCGETFQSTIIVPELAPPLIIQEDLISGACIDSVVGTYRILTAGFQYNAKLILLSGPSVLGSTKPEFAYSDTYTYPDTVSGFNGESFMMNNLSIGTYQYKIIDDCGNEVFGSFTINEQQITSLQATHQLEVGCPGMNKIHYGMVSGGKVTIRNIATNTILKETDFLAYTQNYLAELYNHDSLINLFDGSYEITYEFLQSPGSFENGKQVNDGNIPCWIIVDTVHILPYYVPAMSTGNVIMCNNTINFILIPDTTTGFPPYEYEIIAGPQLFPVQGSNIFTITQPGTYTARIIDACGNASIKQITADTISFDPIQVQANCMNTSMIFPSSIYHEYHWLMPNNQTYIGDSLIINPITAADTGMYEISKIININGCVDTLFTSYHVTLNPHSSQTIEFCSGATVTIGSNIYNLPGIYNDTITTSAGCDSIITSNLILIPQVSDTIQATICYGDSILIAGVYYNTPGFYTDSLQNSSGCYDLVITDLHMNHIVDSITVSICAGDTYSFGGNTYNMAGFYNDTIVTSAGCDSTIILHLFIQPYIQSSITESICAGSNFSFGGNLLTQAGIYIDTLSTLTCDSIVTLTLTISPYINHSITEEICGGYTYSFGSSILSQAGVYTDTLSTATCDSVVTLTLNVLPYIQHSINESICPGGSFSFNGNLLTQAGVYSDTLTTLTCDSIITLTLGISPYINHATTVDICDGYTYSFGGNILSQAGVYTDTLSTTTCDSVVTLTLNVLPYIQYAFTENICPNTSFLFNGNQLTQAGVYIDTLTTQTCDSIVSLTLHVLPYINQSININICEGEQYAFGGAWVNQAGVYVDTLSTSTCDSIITLNLSVSPLKSSTRTQVICEGESYNFAGNTYTSAGTYTHTFATPTCDSTATLILQVRPITHTHIYETICSEDKYPFAGTHYTQPGTYTHTFPTNACDSIVTLHLNVVPTPSVNITFNMHEIHGGQYVQLHANSYSNPLQYLWTSSAALSNYTIQHPNTSIQSPTWVYLTVTDTNGCSATAQVEVTIPVTSTLFIPNCFTPNGDNQNEGFRIYGTNIAEFEMMVFNRWGELIFKSTNMEYGWDGTYMGEIVQNGMYVYKVNARGLDGVGYHRIGRVTVLQ